VPWWQKKNFYAEIKILNHHFPICKELYFTFDKGNRYDLHHSNPPKTIEAAEQNNKNI
jgi:hypothetical protein